MKKRKATTTRDDFEYWLADMDDALENFYNILPENVRQRLDFSPGSLDVLEAWLLEQYADADLAVAPEESRRIDGAARYVGETFRKHLGGKWDIDLENPKFVFFNMPILTGGQQMDVSLCPLTMVTASTDRRTGTFLREILEAHQK